MYKKGIKRLLDITLCSFAAVVLSPAFLLTAILIKSSSPGPALYKSDRAGKDHKRFHFYKFRSMHVTDADKGLFVADKDRLFPVGKMIRRLKIDELPQLINILKGDMSIVGPRPMPWNSVDTTYYGRYQRILTVRPGLTSAASLYDYTVGDTYTDNEKYIKEVLPIKLDMEMLYVEKQSFLYDCNLVWRTVVTILQVMAGKKDFKEQPELAEVRKKRGE